MTIKIIGAGMAGLLAGNLLARHKPKLIEAHSSLPNNHSAVLRFGSPKIGDALGIPFRAVKLVKSTLRWKNEVADALAYSRKCTGISRSDRSLTRNQSSSERWIAPPDLIQRMAADLNIEFGKFYQCGDDRTSPIISTLPMPLLMKQLNYEHVPEFHYVHGANLRARIENCDAYISLYIPDPEFSFNRISITGNELIAEYAFPFQTAQDDELFDSKSGSWRIIPEINKIADLLGFPAQAISGYEMKRQTYAKIHPIDDRTRKNFLAWATDNFGIYSLGRFATWRPGLMLDDLINDVQRIVGWIQNGPYEMKFRR